MTLTQIRYFLKAYETGSITTAAEELFITRSALSKAIKELETECGSALFTHGGGRLIPTATGELLRSKGLEMIALTESTMRLLKSSARDADNTVRIGITPATGISIFPATCRDFRAICPGARFQAIEGGNTKVQNMLESGQMDVCLTTFSETFPDAKGKLKLGDGFCTEKLYDTEIVFCCTPDHPLAGRNRVRLEEIADEGFVFLKKPLQREAEIHSRMTMLGKELNVVNRASQVSISRSIVLSGSAVSLQIKGMIDDGEKVIGIGLDPPAVYSNYMVYSSRSLKNDTVKRFVEFCRSYDYSRLYAFKRD